MSLSTVDIILVNYNGAEDTIMCVESLMRMDFQDFRVLIVENKSTNNSMATLTKYLHSQNGLVVQASDLGGKRPNHKLTMIVSETNKGFAAGNNIAIRYAQASGYSNYVWLLNNDTTVDKAALRELINGYQIRKAQRGINPGVLGSKILFFDRPQVIQAIGGYLDRKRAKIRLIGLNEEDHGQYDNSGENLDMVLGASMFVDTEFLNEVGLLDEDYFLYFEELDWSHRAKELGFLTSCQVTSIVYHKQGNSTQNSVQGAGKSEFAMYYQFANLIRFYKKFYPSDAYRAKLRVLVRLSKFSLKGQLNFWRMFSRIFLKYE
jgi:GT2 family glycosyltransferase